MIRQLLKIEALQRLPEFVDLLRDSVAHGNSIGFVRPFDEGAAESFWRGVLSELPVISEQAAARHLLIAEEAGKILGTVQIVLAPRQNSRHRAEVQKLIVHSSARRQGLARRLMQQIEVVASAVGRPLLILDTETDSPAARLYEQLGWQPVGEIPRFATDTTGELITASIYYKELSLGG